MGRYTTSKLGRLVLVAALLGTLGIVAAGASSTQTGSRARSAKRSARVLLVGRYHGKRGKYRTIQAAVDAARPGDWVLVGPGDYHERADRGPKRGSQPDDLPAGVIVTKPRIHIRGMNRNRVVVDGTLPGAKARCSAAAARQDLGRKGDSGKPVGRNGVLVYKVDGVSVENMTVCNFLKGAGGSGNQVWWNGGDGSGKIGMGSFRGAYLSTTSTYFKDTSTSASYGLFTSNTRGPGVIDQTYASNFDDAGYYIGACQQICNQTMNHAWSQYNALGYSGTNAGGQLLIENSEFDHNKDGFDTNSQNNDDSPSPQDGACLNGGTSRVTHTHSCWVFIHNYVHDNNNPNVPGAGTAAAGPVGTGMSISGARNNTIVGNRIENNGAWGVIFVPYPDTETPPEGQDCQGGVKSGPPSNVCLFDDWGNALIGNRFKNNGFFGNDTNGDFGEITSTGPHPTNCFNGNTEVGGGGVSSSPAGLQESKPACNVDASPDPNPAMTNQVACDSQFFAGLVPTGSSPCTPGSSYPAQTKVVMPPLPHGLRSMPHPCRGVPANKWCRPKKRRT